MNSIIKCYRCGYRRKPYLIVSYLISSICFLLQSLYVYTISEMFILGVVRTIFNCIQIVVVNSVLVSLAHMNDGKESNKGSRYQSWAYGFRTIGYINILYIYYCCTYKYGSSIFISVICIYRNNFINDH